jgi:hypothetical protein
VTQTTAWKIKHKLKQVMLERDASKRLILLCHKFLARFDACLSGMEILTHGGGVWVSGPADTAANHGSRFMSRR